MATCEFCGKIRTQEELKEFVALSESEAMTYCDECLAYDKQGRVCLYIYGFADDPFYNSYNQLLCNYCPLCGRKLN